MSQAIADLQQRIAHLLAAEPDLDPDVAQELESVGKMLTNTRPVPPAPPPPPKPRGVAVSPDGQHFRVEPRNAESAPGARTLQDLLNVMTGKPLGGIAQALLEVAARIEALELENAQLRAQLEGRA